MLRRLSTSLADAYSADDVARSALLTALEVPGVCRAGLALNSAGGRQLQFVSTDDDALTPTRVRWCLIDAFADVPLVETVRHGHDIYLPDPAALRDRYPGFAARQHELGTRSLVALCLATEDERVGGLMLCFEEEHEFPVEQRWLLGAFAAQVTQAVRQGIAYQHQHTTAAQLQRSLMQRSLPDVSGLVFGSYTRAGGLNAEVGGDWYDVIELPDGSTVLALGDVMGKGTSAAIVMGELRSALRAYAVLDPSPGTVLERLDTFVASQQVPEQFVTVAYGLVSPDRTRVDVALAGHPPPVVLSSTGARVLDEAAGSALGVGAGPWPSVPVLLTSGTTVVLYSDGLVESRHRDLATGIGQLAEQANGIPERRRHPRELCARLAQLMTDTHSDDDVTLLALAPAREGEVRRAATPLPADATAPGVARRFLRTRLEEWDVEEDTVEAALLCVSELVTNAVIHTGTGSELSTQVEDAFVTVLVRDGGGAGTVRLPATSDEPLTVSGRGLTLVDAVASAWAAEHGTNGTTVWFEIERPGADG